MPMFRLIFHGSISFLIFGSSMFWVASVAVFTFFKKVFSKCIPVLAVLRHKWEVDAGALDLVL